MKKIKVSIVEDQADIRQSLVRNIDRTEGMTCISDYASAEAALEGLPNTRPRDRP